MSAREPKSVVLRQRSPQPCAHLVGRASRAGPAVGSRGARGRATVCPPRGQAEQGRARGRLLALFCCGGHPGMPTTMSARIAGAPTLRLRFCCVLHRKAGPPPRCSPAPKGRAAVRRSSIGWLGKTQKGRRRACPLPSDADGLLRGPPPASSGRVGLRRQLDPSGALSARRGRAGRGHHSPRGHRDAVHTAPLAGRRARHAPGLQINVKLYHTPRLRRGRID